MSHKKDEGRFKEWALNSGFPFENDVYNLILKKFPEASCLREVSFLTSRNEENLIRSVDFLITLLKNTRNFGVNYHRGISEKTQVKIVIDAKFTKDEYFIFMPSKRNDLSKGWPSLIPIRREYNYLDNGKTSKIVREPKLLELASIPKNIQIANGGKKVKEINNEKDRASVQEAQIQVLQAVEAIIQMAWLSLPGSPQEILERNAMIHIPVIVTNAPLLVLKDHVTTELVKGSQSKEEIFSSVDQVVVEFPNNYEYTNSWNKLKSNFVGEERVIFWDIDRMECPYVYFCNLSGLESLFQHILDLVDKLPNEFG